MATVKIEELRAWVQQYKDDEIIRVGQAGAIKAMEYFLEVFDRHGDLKEGEGGGVAEIKAAQDEVRRCVEILNAFMGKMSIMAFMQGERPWEDCDDDD